MRHKSHGSVVRLARQASLAAACAVLGCACSKSEAAPSRDTVAESVQVASARAEAEQYVAEIKPEGAYKAGTVGTLVVTLASKGAYHTNGEYPYKFQLKDPAPDGVSYPKPVLQRADGSFEEHRASFKVPFLATKPGTVRIGGKLFMSLCSEANCIIDRVPLEVDVDVK
jgi:hypothetical protein